MAGIFAVYLGLVGGLGDILFPGLVLLLTLGAKGSVPGRCTANTLQGNGQSTCHIPAWNTESTFRIFQANFFAVFLVQEMLSTFTVGLVM